MRADVSEERAVVLARISAEWAVSRESMASNAAVELSFSRAVTRASRAASATPLALIIPERKESLLKRAVASASMLS